jgi:hypothetical protein
MDVYQLLGLAKPGPQKRSPAVGPQVIVGGLGPINPARQGQTRAIPVNEQAAKVAAGQALAQSADTQRVEAVHEIN